MKAEGVSCQKLQLVSSHVQLQYKSPLLFERIGYVLPKSHIQILLRITTVMRNRNLGE